MRSIRMKRLLSIVLAVAIIITAVPAMAFAGNGPSGTDYCHVWMVNSDKSSGSYTGKVIYDKTSNATMAGVSYDIASNTVYLTDFNGSDKYLLANEMGDDFKVSLSGENVLGGIIVYGYGYGGSLGLTGNGTLSITGDANMDNYGNFGFGGILIEAENSNAILSVDEKVTLNVRGYENGPAVSVNYSAANPGIVIKGQLSTGSIRSEEIEKIEKAILKDESGENELYLNLYTRVTDNVYFGVETSTWYSDGNQTVHNKVYNLTGTYPDFTAYGDVVYDYTDSQEFALIYSPVSSYTGLYDHTIVDSSNNPLSAVEVLPSDSDPLVRPTVTTSSLPDATIGESYTAQLEAAPGSGGNITGFNPVGGSLPSGLTLNQETGIISGIPTESGSFSLAVVANELVGETLVQSLSKTVTLTVSNPVVTFTAAGSINDYYTRTLLIKKEDVTAASKTISGSISSGQTLYSAALEPGSYTVYMTEVNSYGTAVYESTNFSVPQDKNVSVPVSVASFTPNEGVIHVKVNDYSGIQYLKPFINIEVKDSTGNTLAQSQQSVYTDSVYFAGLLSDDAVRFSAELGFYSVSGSVVVLAKSGEVDVSNRSITLDPASYDAYAVYRVSIDAELSSYYSLFYNGNNIGGTDGIILSEDEASQAEKFSVVVYNASYDYEKDHDMEHTSITIDSENKLINIRFSILNSTELKGKVQDALGNALAGVSVTATQRVNNKDIAVTTVTDSNGNYRISDLISGKAAKINVARTGYESAERNVANPDPDTAEDFTLGSQAYISVSIAGYVTETQFAYSGKNLYLGNGTAFTLPVNGDGPYEVSMTATNTYGTVTGSAVVKNGVGVLTLKPSFYGRIDFSGVNTGQCYTYVCRSDGSRFENFGSGNIGVVSAPAGDYTVYFTKSYWYSGTVPSADILITSAAVSVKENEVTVVEAELDDGMSAVKGSLEGPAEAAYQETYKFTGIVEGIGGNSIRSLRFSAKSPVVRSVVINGKAATLHGGDGSTVSLTPEDTGDSEWTLPLTFTVYCTQKAAIGEYQLVSAELADDNSAWQYDYIGSVSTKSIPKLTINTNMAVGGATPGTTQQPGSISFYGTATPNDIVYLYDNGQLCAVTTVKQNGNYEGTAALKSDEVFHTLRAELHAGNALNADPTVVAETSFQYDPYGPVLSGIWLNDRALNLNGKPSSYTATPTMSYEYRAVFDNVSSINSFKDMTLTVNGKETTGKVFFFVTTAGHSYMLASTTNDGGRTWTSSTEYFGAEYPSGVKVFYNAESPDLTTDVTILDDSGAAGSETVNVESAYDYTDAAGYTEEDQTAFMQIITSAGISSIGSYEKWAEENFDPGTSGSLEQSLKTSLLKSGLDGISMKSSLNLSAGNVNGSNDLYAYIATLLNNSLSEEEKKDTAFGVVNASNAQTLVSGSDQLTMVTYADVPSWTTSQQNVNLRFRELTNNGFTVTESQDENGSQVFIFQKTLYYDKFHNPANIEQFDWRGNPIGSVLDVSYIYVNLASNVAGRTAGGKWFREQTAYLAPGVKSPIYTYPSEIPNSRTGPSSYTNYSPFGSVETNSDGSLSASSSLLLSDASGNLTNEYNPKFNNAGYWMTTGYKKVSGKTFSGKMMSVASFGASKWAEHLGDIKKAHDLVNHKSGYKLSAESAGVVVGNATQFDFQGLWNALFCKEGDNCELDSMYNNNMKNLNYWKDVKEWLIANNKSGTGITIDDFDYDIKLCDDMIALQSNLLGDISEMGRFKQSANIDDAHTKNMSSGLASGSLLTGLLGKGGPEAGLAMDDLSYQGNKRNDVIQYDAREKMQDFAARYSDFAEKDKYYKDYIIGKNMELRKQYPNDPHVLQFPEWMEDDPLRPKDAVTEGNHDPSGIVYEAVLSNPVEGATVTLYKYDSTQNDKVVWDDSDGLGQENPVTTGADGKYSWDVPEGYWFVTAEAAGYTSGSSINDVAAVSTAGGMYLPVLPPQLNVNIPLVNFDTPEVGTVRATTDGLYVTFTKYMKDEDLVTTAFTVDGNAPTAVVKLDSEEAPTNINYGGATPAGFTTTVLVKTSLTTGSNVSFNILASILHSYAGTLLMPYSSSVDVTTPEAVAAPTFTPAAGEVTKNTVVTISAENGADIYYTTDGTDPQYYINDSSLVVKNGTKASSGVQVSIGSAMTIKAIAVKAGFINSDIASAAYTVKINDPQGNNNNNNNNNYSGSSSGDKAVEQKKTAADVFYDVDKDAYYYDALNWALEKGITTGLTASSFAPNSPCTRAQIVTFLYRAAGSPEVSGETTGTFKDVPAGSYYEKAVLWAAQNGITLGTSEDTFSPDLACSRAQVVTFLYRYERVKSGNASAMFDDVNSEDYFYEAVAWALEKGITNGTGNNMFSPNWPCTRAQIITFLYRDMGK